MADSMMGKCRTATLMGLVAGALAAAPAVAQDDLPALKMRATNSYPQDQPPGKALDFFAKRVADLSGGKITVQVFHAGKLYTEDKSVQAVLDGTAEMGMASSSNHGPFTKVWQVVETPFLLDKKQLRAVIIRGQTKHFEQVAIETARGLREVSLKSEVPVILGIIPAESVNDAMERVGIKQTNKGREWALSAIEMASLMQHKFLGAGK